MPLNKETKPFVMKSKWLQIFSGLQDSSKYSCRFQECFGLIDSILPMISSSHGLFIETFGIIPMQPITIGIIVTFMFFSFWTLWQGPRIWLFFSLSFSLCRLLKRQNPPSKFFLILNTKSCVLTGIVQLRYYFHFKTNNLGKAWTPHLIHLQLWVK